MSRLTRTKASAGPSSAFSQLFIVTEEDPSTDEEKGDPYDVQDTQQDDYDLAPLSAGKEMAKAYAETEAVHTPMSVEEQSPPSPKVSYAPAPEKILFRRNLAAALEEAREKKRQAAQAAAETDLAFTDAEEMIQALEESPNWPGWDWEDWHINSTSDEKFDLHSRNVGLTYSQVGTWEAQDIIDELMERYEGDIEDLTVSVEKHKSGDYHFHAFLRWHKKKRIRSSTAFDVGPLHPNIKQVSDKAGMKRWQQYVTKEGRFLSTKKLDMSTSNNFRKRKEDHQAWIAAGCKDLTKQWAGGSISLFGLSYDLPSSAKRRSFWIYGASDVGKTTHLRATLSGVSVFLRRAAPYLYEGYDGQTIIVSDDQHTNSINNKDDFTKAEICHMLQGTWPGAATPVYGVTRYCSYFLQSGINIHYFVLANDAPSFSTEEWFNNRFYLINVISRDDDGVFSAVQMN